MNVNGREFGENIKVSVFSCKGILNESLCNKITTRIISAINMSTNGMNHVCWNYPMNDGKGGSGITFFQPLVESFATWDCWTDLTGAYFVLVSCKEYDPKLVKNILLEYVSIVEMNSFVTGFSNIGKIKRWFQHLLSMLRIRMNFM